MHDSSSRNPGLDLARNLAIFLVVVQHIVFLGGLSNDGMGVAHKLQARFLEALSQCCVDLFGLLTGYLCVSVTRWKWSRFGALWLQVWTTGLLTLGVCALTVLPRPARADWLTAAFPLVRGAYWYFTAYAVVFLLAPLLNRVLFAAGRERFGLLAAGALFAVTCGITVFPGGSALLPLARGYSAGWLICLYVFGAAARCGERRLGAVKPRTFFLGGLFCVGLTVAQRIAMAHAPALKRLFADEWTLHEYTSPTVTLAALFLLLGCSRLTLGRFGAWVRTANARLAACAFGVYLIHVQPFYFVHGFKGRFGWLDRLPDGLFALTVLGTAVAVYLGLAALEGVRAKAVARAVALLKERFRRR